MILELVPNYEHGEPAVISYRWTVQFEEKPVEVQDGRKFTDHFRGICRISPNLIKENRRTSTCNRLDLQTLARITTGYAPKSPRSRVPKTPNYSSGSQLGWIIQRHKKGQHSRLNGWDRVYTYDTICSRQFVTVALSNSSMQELGGVSLHLCALICHQV